MSNTFDFTEKNGLVLCDKPQNAQNNTEVLYVSEAQKMGAYAVLFRRYFREGSDKPYRSEPAVCIFNKPTSFFNTEDHIKLHAALWSAARNEIYIINSSTRQDIITARKPAELDENGKLSIENLLLASSTAIDGINKERFSAYLFGSGTFWEQPEFEKDLDEKNSPYLFLLDYLMTVRKTFLETPSLKLRPETIDKLLVTSILIKFLEEITDDKGKHTLRSIYKKYRISSFAEAVEQNHCVTILNELANEFNGKIFNKFSDEEKAKINKANLTILGNFLKANINLNTNQIFLWEQYSFKHLPAEIISAIYENFIQAEAVRKTGEKEKGVVYTPIHLVNLLIDEVMPLDKPELFKNNSFKVLDPACGSGVFLVAAFKRMLQWWAINNSRPGSIQYPDSKEAQRILENNIFGVDVKKTATLVSVFSLTTALLDKLTPQEIWNKLKFKDLSQNNIQHSSFFDWALLAKDGNLSFQLIVGNPPFNVETDKKKEDVLKKSTLAKLDLKHKNIPANNFALHFFETAMLFAENVCMIIPSSVLLYNKASQKYRNQLFSDYTVKRIFDFTHLRESLFTKKSNRAYDSGKKTGRTPVVAIVVENKQANNQTIEHIVVKRTVSTEKKIRFEIDYYDIHKVKYDWAIDESKNFIWKTNLLGGGRLFHLTYRLSSLGTLAGYIDNQKKHDDSWIYSSGYKIGGDTKKNRASFVKQGDKIEKVLENGKWEVAAQGEQTNMFEFFPDEKMYQPPFIVFDQILGKNNIPVSLVEKYSPKKFLYFSRDFVGIHTAEKNFKALKRIYSFVKDKYNSLYRFYVLLRSGSALVLTETEINKRDIDSIPFPDNEQFLALSKAENIIKDDVLDYYIHLGKAINPNGEGHTLHVNASPDQLSLYGSAYCDVLNEVYAKNGKLWQTGNTFQTDLYTVYHFGYGKKDSLSYRFSSQLPNNLRALIEDRLSNSGAIYTRVVRIYKHIDGYDCVFFIKPNALRYWLQSIALRDADDTIVDLKKGGF